MISGSICRGLHACGCEFRATMHPDAAALIATLGLVAHPEGGYYRETYRSRATVTTEHGSTRNALTSILFLLTPDSFSAFHRLAADEAWHLYRGDALTIEIIAPGGTLERRSLRADGPWQAVVHAGHASAAHVIGGEAGYALVGCDVAPGFDFADFSVCARAELLTAYPQHEATILALTR